MLKQRSQARCDLSQSRFSIALKVERCFPQRVPSLFVLPLVSAIVSEDSVLSPPPNLRAVCVVANHGPDDPVRRCASKTDNTMDADMMTASRQGWARDFDTVVIAGAFSDPQGGGCRVAGIACDARPCDRG